MELKNAGFENADESRKKAMNRMIDGERFKYGKWDIFYSRDGFKFVAENKGIGLLSGIPINDMTNWQLEIDWKAELSPDNPRWCKVWDDDEKDADFVNLNTYTKVSTDPFRRKIKGSKYVDCWRNARVVSTTLSALLDAEMIVERT